MPQRPSVPGMHPPMPRRVPGVSRIVAVASGKGGVGKSTVAVNLALALHARGLSIGLLDADIYGPSIPIMLGLRDERPQVRDERTIVPVQRFGLDTISMGMLLRADDAVVWRGPMLGKALQQFLEDVDWGDKDYLIVDLPPGTGDVQLSLAQLVPVTAAVVVTTPQDVAMADVRRAIRMFELTRTPVAGVVENMAFFTCPDCGKDYAIFGQGRTQEACDELGLPLLGRFPLDMTVGPAADRGEPIFLADPEGGQARRYRELADTLVQRVDALVAERPDQRFQDFFGKGPTG